VDAVLALVGEASFRIDGVFVLVGDAFLDASDVALVARLEELFFFLLECSQVFLPDAFEESLDLRQFIVISE
jgi:hypothetical protein